ncbi:unnamed protein product [Porites lobata]|uniref:EGF-like domain-containing protein n=1 Tax=Porites lobata TaxID=104759 RepID=A0ABN8RX22_9CNID|nr:unnamed protein product [Porites lobata]
MAIYPLNRNYTTEDLLRRPEIKGVAHNVELVDGPYNVPDGAYQFKGQANSYIEFPNGNLILDAKYSITLMCWVKPGDKDGPLFNYNKNDWGVHIWLAQAGRFFVRITKAGSHAFHPFVQTVNPLPIGKWAHVAATYDFNTGYNAIYVDGVLQAPSKNVGRGSPSIPISTNDPEVRMGARLSDGRYFNGAICQMGIWNVALTQEQIAVEMRKKALPRGVLPMVAYTGRLRPKGVPFFRLQVYERAGISLVKIYMESQKRCKVLNKVCERGTICQKKPTFEQLGPDDLVYCVTYQTAIRQPKLCDINPCEHGGTCMNDGNSFKCVCPEGYTGRTCGQGNLIGQYAPSRARLNGFFFTASKTKFRISYRIGLHSVLLPLRTAIIRENTIPSSVLPLPVVPPALAIYPLNGNYTTEDLLRRPAIKGVAHNVELVDGPYNVPDGAYQFKGQANSYIEFPNGNLILDAKYSITLMCWVKPGGKDGPLFNYNKNDWGVHIWLAQAGRFFVRITKAGSHAFHPFVQTVNPLPIGKWAHVAATYDFNTGYNAIYVDGVLQAPSKNVGRGSPSIPISTNDPEVRMGARLSDGRYFNGAICQMGIWNVALTQEQIEVEMRKKGNLKTRSRVSANLSYFHVRQIHHFYIDLNAPVNSVLQYSNCLKFRSRDRASPYKPLLSTTRSAMWTFEQLGPDDRVCCVTYQTAIREPKPCDINPCEHGGTCMNVGKSFKCVCPKGYTGPTGDFCLLSFLNDIDIDECAYEKGGCLDIRVNTVGSYYCS